MRISKKVIKEIAYSLGSAAITAAIMYVLMPLWMAVMVLTVLVIHEMGHYIAAKALGLEVHAPLYIPLPFLALAITYVPRMSGWSQARIAVAGPVAGALASLCFLIASLLVGAYPAAWTAAILLAGEILWGFLGNDGKTYRKATKRSDANIPVSVFEGDEAVIS